MKESVFSICGMCTVRCPIKVDVEDGVVKWIEGNPNDPGMAGRLCAKGSAGLAMLYDYERPQHPMIREGKRGEGKWKKASWDEALDYIVTTTAHVRVTFNMPLCRSSAQVAKHSTMIMATASIWFSTVEMCLNPCA
jgi:thiosulfate reductase/polysulfide reductase chain A